MSNSSSPNVNVMFGADTANLRAQIAAAQAAVQNFNSQIRGMATANAQAGGSTTNLSAGFVALNAAAGRAQIRLAEFRNKLAEVSAEARGVGMSLGQAAYNSHVLVDELASGRTSQMTGTIFRLWTTVLAANPALALMGGAAMAAAGSLAYMAYQALQTTEATRQATAAMATNGNLDAAKGQLRAYVEELRKMPDVTADDAAAMQTAIGSIHNYSAGLNELAIKVLPAVIESTGKDAPKAMEALADAIDDPDNKGMKFLETLGNLTAAERTNFEQAKATGNVNSMNAAIFATLSERYQAGRKEVDAATAAQVTYKDVMLEAAAAEGGMDINLDLTAEKLKALTDATNKNIEAIKSRNAELGKTPLTPEQAIAGGQSQLRADNSPQIKIDQENEAISRLKRARDALSDSTPFGALDAETAKKNAAALREYDEQIRVHLRNIQDIENAQNGGSPGDRDRSNLAADANLPNGFRRATAQIESAGGQNLGLPGASHQGTYQFGATEWEQNGGGSRSRLDPDAQEEVFSNYAQKLQTALTTALGHPPTAAELYLAWQQGATGAAKMLQNPSMAPAQLGVGANVANNGGNPNAPSSQYIARTENLYNQKSKEAGISSSGGNAGPDDLARLQSEKAITERELQDETLSAERRRQIEDKLAGQIAAISAEMASRKSASSALEVTQANGDSARILQIKKREYDEEVAARGAATTKAIQLNAAVIQAQQQVDAEEYQQTKASEEEKLKAVVDSLKAQEQAIKSSESGGLLSRQKGSADLVALLEKEKAAYTSYYDAILADANISTSQRIEMEKRRSELMATYSAKEAAVAHDAATKTAESYKQAFESIGSTVTSGIMRMITGTQSLRQTMIRVADQILESFIGAGVKMAADWAGQQAYTVATTVSGEAAKTGAVAAGTAARTGLEATASAASGAATGTAVLKSVIASAAETFAGIFGFLSPVMGPAAAAPAAAGEATVLAVAGGIGNYAVGAWNLPTDQIAQVHAGEMIIPAGPAAAMRAAMTQGGTTGQVSVQHQTHFNVTAIDAAGVKSFFKNNKNQILRSINDGIRTGAHLGFSKLG